MYSQTTSELQDRLTDLLIEKNKTAQTIYFTPNEDNIASLELDKLCKLADKTIDTIYIESSNVESSKISAQTSIIEYPKKLNTPTIIWISYVNDLISPPFFSEPVKEKRISEEIVKRYSLTENVQNIYLSEVSYYVNIDVVLNSESISNRQYENFFEYEKQLLSIFNLPINFNYHLNNTFHPPNESVLIFEK